MVTKVIELKDVYDNLLLPYAFSAHRDGNNNDIASTYATITTVNTKQDTITGAATSVVSSDLPSSKVLISNVSGKIATSSVTSNEIEYLSGTTANIQTQINTLRDMIDISGGSAGDVMILNDDQTKIVPGGSLYRPGLFTYQPSDHLLNDIQWLRADTFSWQSGDVYKTAYNHLVNDLIDATEEKVFYKYHHCYSVGPVENNNGVISNFNNDNYLVTPSFNPGSSPWVHVTKFKTNSNYSVGQILVHPYNVGCNIASWITTAGKLSMHASSNGTSWNICSDILGTTTLLPNTVYYTKFQFTGTAYQIYLSTDGIQWNLECNFDSTTTIISSDAYGNKYGSWTDGRYVANIDIKESYYMIGDTRYNLADSLTKYNAIDGHEIAYADQEDIVAGLYNEYGQAYYYILDTENTRFKLPRIDESKVNHGRLVKKYKSEYKWYRLYADGWCEQGDRFYTDVNGWQNATATLLIPYRDVTYHVSITSSWGGNGDGASYYYANNNKTVNKFVANITQLSTSYGYATWKASGYTSIIDKNTAPKEKYLYFYVGEFTQPAIEETAGITVEVLNDKLDTNLNNSSYPQFDCVVEYKMPTDEDPTWYRKYKSGWMEQGGRNYPGGAAASLIFTFPFPFKTKQYWVRATNDQVEDAGINVYAFRPLSNTQCYLVSAYNGTFYNELMHWTACGY